MPKRKRDFDNPVLVKMTTKDGRELSFPVSKYSVNDRWIVLEHVDESRVTKYVSLDSLAKFEFDEPLNYRATMPQQVDVPVASGLPVSASPERDALVARLQAGTPKRVVNPKAVPAIPNVSEGKMIEANMKGVGIAMMGD